MDCSICIQPCLKNQTAVGDLIHTHCNHIFHSNCMEQWNHSSQANAAACPNCRTELIEFFIDETDDGNELIVEANAFIPNGTTIQQIICSTDHVCRKKQYLSSLSLQKISDLSVVFSAPTGYNLNHIFFLHTVKLSSHARITNIHSKCVRTWHFSRE